MPPHKPSELVVVITMYNSAATIDETMQSLAAQTYRDFTCVVVNDGSTDFGPEIVARMCEHDRRFRMVTQPNRGLAGARNRGLEDALRTGATYVHFLDSDDWMTPRGLEWLVRAADETGASYGGYELRDQFGQPLGRQSPVSAPYVGFDEELEWNRTATHAHLFRVDAIGDKRFDESLKVVEDYDLWLRLAISGVRWKGVERIVAGYRLRPGSMSKDFGAMSACYERVVRKVMDQARAMGWESRASGAVDLSERRFRRVVGNAALTYATMDALMDESPAKERAVKIFGQAARPDRATPAWAAQAASTALLFGACTAPDIDGWSERRWLIPLRDWWNTCAREGWLDSFELEDCWRELSRKIIHPDQIALAMLDALPHSTTSVGVCGLDKFGRRLARLAAARFPASRILAFDDSSPREEVALLADADEAGRIDVVRDDAAMRAHTMPQAWLLPPTISAAPAVAGAHATSLLRWNTFRDRIAAANLERILDAIEDAGSRRGRLMVG
jgi:hypothetical protein